MIYCEILGRTCSVGNGVWTGDTPALTDVLNAREAQNRAVHVGPDPDPDHTSALMMFKSLGDKKGKILQAPPPPKPDEVGRIY